MSMLSSQADELRLMARLVRDYDYKEISRMLREAADTIISLRDRLQDAELGRGTCKQILTDCDDGLMPPFTAHCSACGAEWGFTPNYCPNCGCEVER